jgi:hypothetical protein
MVTDHQVRRLMKALQDGRTLEAAADQAGMDPKTARGYRGSGKLPSDCWVEHTWRTRPDAFEGVWGWVAEQLSLNPGLEAKTLFEAMQREYPGRFQDGQLRTLQRQVKRWRATQGPCREVFFAQVHHPGGLCQSDFTHMSALAVTIGGRALDHLLYHFVLTYSNWETCTLCYSESFESLSQGLQEALWELGGVPRRHRTDRLSAAVLNMGNREEFTRRYADLLSHYGLEGQKTNAGHGNENGDVEQRHHRFKRAVEQALLLRGSRDFADLAAYTAFLGDLTARLNAGRADRLAEERPELRGLPAGRIDAVKRLVVRVDRGSLIHVDRNAYSVHSRLIGQKVEVRQYAQHLEVWYGQKLVERLGRLRGRRGHRVDYRHIIDWLVRKPGAFADYQYRQDLFPSSLFRLAYDDLTRHRGAPGIPGGSGGSGAGGGGADRQYLKILELAARQSQALVEAAIGHLAQAQQPMSAEAIEALVRSGSCPPAPPAGQVAEVDLLSYDALLSAEPAEAVEHEAALAASAAATWGAEVCL